MSRRDQRFPERIGEGNAFAHPAELANSDSDADPWAFAGE
jgi:hypothetical protein